MTPALARFRRRPALAWGFALLCFGVCLGGRFMLDPLLGLYGLPFLMFFPAVLVATLVSGLWPGIAVTLLSAASSWYWFIEPRAVLRSGTAADLTALGIFLVVALADCVLVGAMHRALETARAARAEAMTLAAELERRIAERSKALEAEQGERLRAETALAEARRMESLGQLTGGVAHDFNNLLTVVVGQAGRIHNATEDERIRRMAAMARRAAERGAELTRQLLAFSRRQVLQPQTLDVAEFLPPLRELISRTIGENISVTVEAQGGLWPVRADPAQFESAILNLAINGRDAMPNGGTLRLRATNAPLSGAAAAALGLDGGNYVAVRVSDTGYGMDAATLARAFEPFFTTKEVGRGTGLGLAQLWGFAQQSGGTATIDSTPGLGTVVTLFLPRDTAARDAARHERAVREGGTREEAEPEETVPKATGHDAADGGAAEDAGGAPDPHPVGTGDDLSRLRGEGRTVLLVEDQPELRDVVEATLWEAGFRVRTAPSGVAALKLLADAAPDLLLTDLMMPGGVGGMELARHVRARAPRTRVLLMSGYTPDFAEIGADEAGMLPLLRKPFGPAELLRAATAALRPATAAGTPVDGPALLPGAPAGAVLGEMPGGIPKEKPGEPSGRMPREAPVAIPAAPGPAGSHRAAPKAGAAEAVD